MLNMKPIKEAIRSKYAWPGGYQYVLVMSGGEYLCMDCARKEFRMLCKARVNPWDYPDWRAIAPDIYWEGPTVQCCHCNAQIESEYGDPAESDAN